MSHARTPSVVAHFTILLVGICWIAGCGGPGWAPAWSQANPETRVEVDPIHRRILLYNSKDTTVELDEFSGQTDDGKQWVVKGLSITDNASGPRMANVAQLEQVGIITREAMAPLSQFLGLVATRMQIPAQPQMPPEIPQPIEPQTATKDPETRPAGGEE